MTDRAHQHITYTVSGMSCQGCVNKVRQKLLALDSHAEVIGHPKDNRLEISSTLSNEQIAGAITDLGYQFGGEVPSNSNKKVNQVADYKVLGMSCQGCVKKVRTAIQSLDEHAQVDGFPQENRPHLVSTLKQDEVADAVQAAGYQFDGVDPDTAKQDKPTQNDVTDKEEHKAQQASVGGEATLDNTFIQLSLSGITCAGCVDTIQKALDALPTVTHAEVNFASRTAQVSGDTSAEQLISAVTDAGYGASLIEDPSKAQDERAQSEQKEYRYKRLYAASGLAVGVPLMLWGLLGGSMHVATHHEQLAWGAIGVLTLLVMVFAGRHYYSSAWKAFTHRHSNMDTLIAIGTGSAWLYSMAVVLFPEVLPSNARHLYFEASTMILGLVNLGQALEVRARGKTSEALKRLLDLRPSKATVIRSGKTETVDVTSINIDEIIRIKAGEKLPVDGVITEGYATIDESMLTGEPIPIEKSVDSQVSAGTINGNSSFQYKATKVGGDTLLAQIITLVSKAQNSKPPISRLADTVSSVFVPSVMIIAIIAALFWLNLGPAPVAINMLVAAISVLIIACPCALGLATPISTMIGVGKAAEYGALIRNGDALQKASEINTIVLDKTGTITEGKPKVTQSEWFDIDETLAKRVIYALESGANHPLAQALMLFSEDQADTAATVKKFESITGQGVAAEVDGTYYLLGNDDLMRSRRLSLPNTELVQTVGSHVYLANADKVLGVCVIEDEIKPTSKAAIEHFHQAGIKVIMLTGDNSVAAKAVAESVNIDEYKAQMRPEDKLEYVKQLQSKGAIVGMIGDGINDAPALAQADVGFAMGAGTDVAMESADITLIGNDLNNVANAIHISQATLTNIKQNLWGAFAYNSLGIPVAAGVLFPFTGWLLSPVIAGVAMSLSSVTVVLNANRLRLFKPAAQKED
ncbi:Copper-exporting P-type ATPase A [Marinomonas aquimarina]|uniref:Copper-exporting P-type ATPase n=1 Tax=Marinomonas aquimarina TaxID=295068 RepID=A0A1A8TH78_9GAMM|nr:copper-translocating P-type ATPase [Marinomonas aquimarina]SBS31399.1 Copper-exporting P-type ATPase A [Marinomonas aquimarina]